MKTRFTKSIVTIASLAAVLGASLLASAEDNPNGEEQPAHREPYLHHGRGGFMTGVCVGQALAQQGVTITPGSDPRTWDQGTQSEFKAAVETCRSEERGSPSPGPSAAPSAAPSAEPSTAPAPTGTATGTPTATPTPTQTATPTPSGTVTSSVR
jgi:hypothetical protein